MQKVIGMINDNDLSDNTGYKLLFFLNTETILILIEHEVVDLTY